MEQVDSLKTGKKFKKTEIGEIPVDWEVADLSEVIFSYKNGIWGDDPTLDEKSYPIIRSTEITHDGKLDLSSVAFRKIPEAQIRKYKLQDNDILLVASSGSPNLIGRSALFKQSHDKRIFLFSNFMIRIRPEKIDHYFLFYFLNSQYYHNFLTFLQQTSTGLRNLPKKEFIKMKLPFPPLPEQKKIAEILSTVDETIEKSDEIIEKTKELKKGLMQEFLTCGIGHKKFKKTKIGEIPVDWEVSKLERFVSITSGEACKYSKEAGAFPYSVYGSNGIVGYYNKFNFSDGFVIGRVGASGSIQIISTPIWATDNTLLLSIDSNIMEKVYLFYYLQKCRLPQLATKTAQPLLTQKILKSIDIAVPPFLEQKKIAEILSTVDEQMEKEINCKEDLEFLKRGLMQVLLTGKVRVKV